MMPFHRRTVFILLASVTACYADYDCSLGCSMDPEEMGLRVCGEDGITYVNECVAICQVSLYVSGEQELTDDKSHIMIFDSRKLLLEVRERALGIRSLSRDQRAITSLQWFHWKT
jgi:hypothetical protein